MAAFFRAILKERGYPKANIGCFLGLVASYERFKAWQLSYEFVVKLYSATDSFPKYELYGLTAQMRRAAFSVVANIAEGAAKQDAGEFRRFLDIAVGSITELEVALRLARDRKYLSCESWAELERLRNHSGAVTWRLYRAVEQKRRRVR